jgi:hypothetical protein
LKLPSEPKLSLVDLTVDSLIVEAVVAWSHDLKTPSLAQAIRLLVSLSLSMTLTILVLSAKDQKAEEVKFSDELAKIPVEPPLARPTVSQQSIDLALMMFGIQVPKNAYQPVLDRELRDRGLTTRNAFLEKAKVSVGSAAFASWSLLGSTLAHELEVHCQQNFFMIFVLDSLGFDGTGLAERQAYNHELQNRRRFGLEQIDADLIYDTMAYYYPDKSASEAEVPKMIKAWMARNLISTSDRVGF